MDFGFTIQCSNAECNYIAPYLEWIEYMEKFKKELVFEDGRFLCPKCKTLHSGTNVILSPIKEESEV